MVPPPLSHAIAEGEESGPTTLSDHIQKQCSFYRDGVCCRNHRSVIAGCKLVSQ